MSLFYGRDAFTVGPKRRRHAVTMRQLCFPILEPLRGYITAPDAEERPLLDALARRGVHSVFVDWKDVSGWPRGAAVSPKYLWGYHVWTVEFARFLDDLAGARTINHQALLRWNADKSYLKDLQSRGFGVAEVELIPRKEAVDLARLAAERGWDEVVIKPSVSAGSHDTHRSAGPVQRLQPLADRILTRTSLLVQPLFEEIVRDGETTLLFFGGQPGHPSPGSWRALGQAWTSGTGNWTTAGKGSGWLKTAPPGSASRTPWASGAMCRAPIHCSSSGSSGSQPAGISIASSCQVTCCCGRRWSKIQPNVTRPPFAGSSMSSSGAAHHPPSQHSP